MGLPPMIWTPTGARLPLWTVVGLGALLLGAAPAAAQSASSTLSAFTRGYGAGLAGVSNPVNVSTQDTLGGVSFSGGVLQAPSGSLFANLSPLGGTETTTSVGTASSTASGPSGGLSGKLDVVVPGSAASSPAVGEINGKVNLDGTP